MPVKLNLDALGGLCETIAVPNYERARLSAGIVHIGIGNFHRSHQAVYLDDLFNRGLDLDWGIIGAGIMPQDSHMRARLKKQDWLSTLVELNPSGHTARICGSLIDFTEVSVPNLVDALARPEIRIVSMTITEGGYFIDESTGGFDLNHPDIKADIAAPDAATTVFGALIAALARRKQSGCGGFAVVSCDNLPENGLAAKRAVLGLARAARPEIADWIEDNVSFPNGMVDCITPATGKRELCEVSKRFGIEDECAVVCEPFREWILEDDFPRGRPRLEEAGVKFVSKVAPFETMKLRILNGGHAAIAYPAALLGLRYVHEAMAAPAVRGFFEKVAREEILPTVLAPDTDLNAYLAQTEKRFCNAEIGDTIRRLCLDGSNRQPKFILPSVRDRLSAGQAVRGLALEIALWCRYCCGTDDAGAAVEIEDPKADMLRRYALCAKEEPSAFLRIPGIFDGIGEHPEFAEAFSSALNSLWNKGTQATLADYLAA